GLGVEWRGAFRPRRDGAAGQGLLRVGNDQILVEGQLDAQPVAGRTGAERVVEREQARLDLGDGEARDRTGELFREQDALRLGLTPIFVFWRIGEFGDGQAVGQAQGGFQAVGQARHDAALDHDAVDDDVDIVLQVLFELGRVLDGIIGAVDLQALEALLLQFGDFLAVLALAPADIGRQQQQPRAFGQQHDLVDHLRNGLGLDRQAGGRRVGDADPRPQQAHIVVDFGDRADGRTRVLRGRLLFDRDGRREAFDQVNIGLGHQLQELARIGRQAFDITALAFGIDGVESERRLARAGQAGQDDELAARYVDIDSLEVMLARAAHLDEVLIVVRVRHARCPWNLTRGKGVYRNCAAICQRHARTFWQLDMRYHVFLP